MYVVHLENNEVTRAQLARLLSVHGDHLGEHQYSATEAVSDVRRRLQNDEVVAMVLDLGLNPAWDNRYLPNVLRHLALGEELAAGVHAADCVAHGLTLLAREHDVPCAVLTNYADYTGGDPPLTEEKLREAFQVRAIFHKDGDGLSMCADWVRRVLDFG